MSRLFFLNILLFPHHVFVLQMVIFMESSYSAATFEGLPDTIDGKMLYENHN